MNVNILDILTFAAATAAFLYAMRNARANETLADVLTRLASTSKQWTSATGYLRTAVQHQTTGINEQQTSFDRLRQSITALADNGGNAGREDLRAIASQVETIRNEATSHNKDLAEQFAGIATTLNAAIETMAGQENDTRERLSLIQTEVQTIRNNMGGTLLETDRLLRTRTNGLAKDIGNRIAGLQTTVEKLREDLQTPPAGRAARNQGKGADKKKTDRKTDKAPPTNGRRRGSRKETPAKAEEPTPGDETGQAQPTGTPPAAEEPPAPASQDAEKTAGGPEGDTANEPAAQAGDAGDTAADQAEGNKNPGADGTGEDAGTSTTGGASPKAESESTAEGQAEAARDAAEPAPDAGEATPAQDDAGTPPADHATEAAENGAQHESNEGGGDTPKPEAATEDAGIQTPHADHDTTEEPASAGDAPETAGHDTQRDSESDGDDGPEASHDDNAGSTEADGTPQASDDGSAGAPDADEAAEQTGGDTSLPAGDEARNENAPVTDPPSGADEGQPQGATAQAGAAETETERTP